MPNLKPLIAISADRRQLGAHQFHCVGEKYIKAVSEGAGGVPLLLPSLGDDIDMETLLERVDGVMLTGSPSNVEPHRYGGPASDPGTLHDAHRDATTLPLIERILARGVPLLGICRGFQEMNVAFGGSLWQKLQAVEGLRDHREDKDAELDVQYAPAHEVTLTPDGILRGLAESDRLMVNSLHAQGIQTLGRGLQVEAVAPDGVIEAFSIPTAAAFTVAVQWHPEWKFQTNEFSVALFAAFGAAARQRARRLSV